MDVTSLGGQLGRAARKTSQEMMAKHDKHNVMRGQRLIKVAKSSCSRTGDRVKSDGRRSGEQDLGSRIGDGMKSDEKRENKHKDLGTRTAKSRLTGAVLSIKVAKGMCMVSSSKGKVTNMKHSGRSRQSSIVIVCKAWLVCRVSLVCK